MTGQRVYLSFLMRRVQPIKQRCTPEYMYSGSEDPSRNKPEDMSEKHAMLYVRKYMPNKEKTVPAMVMEITEATRTPEVTINTL